MIEAILAVWTSLATWLTGQFPNIESLFVKTTGETTSLTFVGVMAVVMAGIGLILLVFNLIRSFLPMHA